jgi:ribosomal-protein-alanine N-acetyltransferase
MGYGEDDRGFASTLQLTTGRLVLRPVAAGDRAQMAKLSANPAIAQNLIAIPSPHAGECGESFVVASRIGEIVGSAAYGPMADRRSLVEVAVWIAEPFWGQGYATEATQAVIAPSPTSG